MARVLALVSRSLILAISACDTHGLCASSYFIDSKCGSTSWIVITTSNTLTVLFGLPRHFTCRLVSQCGFSVDAGVLAPNSTPDFEVDQRISW